MSANFTGVTFPNQKVTPANDAVIRRAIFDDGILTGCDLSYSGSTLTMTAGQLMICGRQIIHPSSQNWAVTEATSGYARLVLTIDVTRTSTKDTFDQVVDEIQYATAANGFTDLTQSDINAAGTRYQVAVCVVSLGPGGITGIVSKLDVTEGGGAGGNLKVIALAGVAVTVTKGSKVKQKVADAAGVAMFTGLETGTWTVTLPADVSPPTRTVDIDVDYVVVIAYFSATINITYPAGSTCTCSDGTTTLSAPDTSGTWACAVPNAGTWTVNSTNGDKSKSADVVITANGQSESVTLLYITYLFKDGETYDSLTGGWQGTVNTEKQALQLTASAGKTASVWTQNKVDLTDYSSVSVKSDSNVFIGLSIIIASAIGSTSGQVATAQINGSESELSLDISAITGEYFVWLSAYSEKGSTRYVYEVSLE